MPLGGELANQNIKDRFHGSNDPVAAKIMRRFTNSDDGTPSPVFCVHASHVHASI
jgi:hypothetical protein